MSDSVNNLEFIINNFPHDITSEMVDIILNPEIISKYLKDKDYERLKCLLPDGVTNEKKFIFELLDKKDKIKFIHPVEIFKNMINNNYFTHKYQNNLERLKTESLESLIKLYEKTYFRLRDNKPQYLNLLLNNYDETSDNEDNKNLFVNEELFEEGSISSGYTTLFSEEIKEDILEQDLSFSNYKIEELGYETLFSNERFKNLKINKNQLTIRPRSKEEIKEYQRQEAERYKNPQLPWEYKNPDGSISIVAPVVKKIQSANSSKPRDHALLKPDRPPYVTILCLGRDAAARLQDGVGTRADICDLLKDSQYVNERLSDSQINNIVSGALDRLHYEKDPCVKYDLQRKLWIYLHKNRSLDYTPWNRKNETELELKEGDEEEKQVIQNKSNKNKSKKKNSLLKIKRKHSR